MTERSIERLDAVTNRAASGPADGRRRGATLRFGCRHLRGVVAARAFTLGPVTCSSTGATASR
jgi:hypothetical protein